MTANAAIANSLSMPQIPSITNKARINDVKAAMPKVPKVAINQKSIRHKPLRSLKIDIHKKKKGIHKIKNANKLKIPSIILIFLLVQSNSAAFEKNSGGYCAANFHAAWRLGFKSGRNGLVRARACILSPHYSMARAAIKTFFPETDLFLH